MKKAYFIWSDYERCYLTYNEPTENPFYYPCCFETPDSAEKFLKKEYRNLYKLDDKVEMAGVITLTFKKLERVISAWHPIMRFLIVERDLL